MRPATVSRQFLLLLTIAFSLVVAFAVRLTYQFARYSAEGARLTNNLQNTFALNQELRQGINDQINLLHRQFEEPDPLFPDKFSAINYNLGERQTQYLKLNIGERERFTVEKIKSLHSELGVQSIQIFQQLQLGNRSQALSRINRVEELGNQIDKEFAALNELQTRKLQEVLEQLNRSVSIGYTVIYGFASSLVLTLIAFTLLLRKRVLQPLRSILDATDQIRQGNFSTRIPVSRLDEIGRLAKGFNFMADSLAESYAGLERKVEERTQQLRELQQQLVQAARMSAVRQLVSGVAHELNNPLTVIMGFAELRKMELVAGKADPKEIKLMNDIHSHADRCRRIVANLLQFARQKEPHLEAVSINEVIESVLQLREHELETKNIRLVRRYDATNPVICADLYKIQQVMLNLLNNAYDAIQEAGRPGTIQVRTVSQRERVIIEFLDNGTGIREPERIFDPFYTTKEVGKGTGLGLSVCYGIVQEHNGEIRAENTGKGARFVITLPVGNPEMLQRQPGADPQSRTTKQARQKRQALIVDDEETIVRLQISFLSTMGITATGVASGDEAVRFLQEHPVDIIISDVRMPGTVDGIHLYNWVRNNRPQLLKRFLFVSGDLVGMNTGQFFLQSSVPRIQKPFKFDDYSRIVRQVLEN